MNFRLDVSANIALVSIALFVAVRHVKFTYRILEEGRGKKKRKSCRFDSFYGWRFSPPLYKVP